MITSIETAEALAPLGGRIRTEVQEVDRRLNMVAALLEAFELACDHERVGRRPLDHAGMFAALRLVLPNAETLTDAVAEGLGAYERLVDQAGGEGAAPAGRRRRGQVDGLDAAATPEAATAGFAGGAARRQMAEVTK